MTIEEVVEKIESFCRNRMKLIEQKPDRRGGVAVTFCNNDVKK